MSMAVQSVPSIPADHWVDQAQSGTNLLELLFRAGLGISQTTGGEQSRGQGNAKTQILAGSTVSSHMSPLNVSEEDSAQNGADSKDSTQCSRRTESGSSIHEVGTDNQQNTSCLNQEETLFEQSTAGSSTSDKLLPPDHDADTVDRVANGSLSTCSEESKALLTAPIGVPDHNAGTVDPVAHCSRSDSSEESKALVTMPIDVPCTVSSLESQRLPLQKQTPSCSSDMQLQALGAMYANTQQPDNAKFHEAKFNDNSFQDFCTTVRVSFLPSSFSMKDMHKQLDMLGLRGTYDFLYFRSNRFGKGSTGTAYINFVLPTFALVCRRVFPDYVPGSSIEPAAVQGFEPNVALLNQLGSVTEIEASNIFIEPPKEHDIFDAPRSSPQIKEQFRKTKMCIFHRKNRCALGTSCSFAHSDTELQPTPNLEKTRLCFNYFRNQCYVKDCKFAHGYNELRATDTVYKTELCRWSIYGWCKAGDSCRYAHTQEEMRSATDGVQPTSQLFCADELTTIQTISL